MALHQNKYKRTQQTGNEKKTKKKKNQEKDNMEYANVKEHHQYPFI